ncbi:DNA mismatch repair endonuclease MutH [Shewanella woodyi]|uniref:DNA mismatch repair protein MutH n=1 Tax=Shewanella woodyi (strain ATCC 51908 / MS32) TaxID=392500 RepID=MUTH_SHEWM|nr:DNA mismatch repair endonuclease MutH [Shewanella woodyi]B1KI41.1 RecName: Full=DNA mismatch repair protein MutH; AltName: Full=Methyl-directed mismatch repair protein [Shewanella woodyi ATCC 51908]ACA85519.1 DNA mismatch repair endonuclease mutH [Shewanella woodyi ATCC 51908]
MTTPHSPKTIDELMSRANDMAGLTLGQLADSHGFITPANLKRDKGWVGQLIEHELGALAGSRPEPDFLHLGIELKTIPVDKNGKPIETTYVTVAPLIDIQGLTWETSVVCHKLQTVLWIPIQGDRDIPVSQRQIGSPILWRPNEEELALLKQDWEEIMEFIALGQVKQLTARHGEVLQLRPKGANSRSVTQSIGPNGSTQMTNPRGFYLKIPFTQSILSRAFGIYTQATSR